MQTPKSLPRRILRCAILTIFVLFSTKVWSAAVVSDVSGLLATMEIESAPANAPGFTRHTISLTPMMLGDEISSISAEFTGTGVRQVIPNIGGTDFATVFSDFNGLINISDSSDSDSQFSFLRSNLLVTPGSEVENSTTLSASFTGFAAITAKQPIAQIVLPTGTIGTANLSIAVRRTAMPLNADVATFSSVNLTAVPEPSAFLLLCLVGVVSRFRRVWYLRR